MASCLIKNSFSCIALYSSKDLYDRYDIHNNTQLHLRLDKKNPKDNVKKFSSLSGMSKAFIHINWIKILKSLIAYVLSILLLFFLYHSIFHDSADSWNYFQCECSTITSILCKNQNFIYTTICKKPNRLPRLTIAIVPLRFEIEKI